VPRSVFGNEQVDHDLTDHEDIDGGPGQTPSDGDALVYSVSAGGWILTPVAGGHDRGHELWDVLDHTDTQGTPTDGQAIIWNATANKWEPGEAGGHLHYGVYVDTDDGNAQMVYCETVAGEIDLVEVDS